MELVQDWALGKGQPEHLLMEPFQDWVSGKGQPEHLLMMEPVQDRVLGKCQPEHFLMEPVQDWVSGKGQPEHLFFIFTAEISSASCTGKRTCCKCARVHMHNFYLLSTRLCFMTSVVTQHHR